MVYGSSIRFFIWLWALMIAGTTQATLLSELDTGWEIQNPVERDAHFQHLVEKGTQRGDTAFVVEAMTQLARSMGMQRRFDEAHASLNQAEGLLSDEMYRPRVRLLLERGRVINSGGSSSDSIAYFKQARALAEANGWVRCITTLPGPITTWAGTSLGHTGELG